MAGCKFFCLLFFLLGFWTATTVSQRSSSGEACGESSGRQCVGLAGESCINSRCIENATCSNETFCVCDDGFYQDDDKNCVKKEEPLGSCTRDDQCDNFRGSQLICLDGACSCDPTYSRYGTSQKHKRDNWYYGYYDSRSYEEDWVTQCLGLAGSPCLDRFCIHNSYCDFNIKEKYNQDNSGTCKCMSGYKKSKNGTCPAGDEGTCTHSDGCLGGLICKDNYCRCPFHGQDFDSSTKKCLSKVDGPCNSSTSCVANAQCIIFSRTPIEAGHCSCKKGYIKNSEGECSARFGQPCYSAADCDNVAPLACIDRICQCDDFAKYSEQYRKCLGLVGASCDLDSTELEPQCVENSKCERVHPRLQGVCTCSSGFNETSLYTCE